MRRSRLLIVAAVAALAVTAVGFAVSRRQATQSEVVHSSRTISYSSLQDVSALSTAEIADLMDNQAWNQPPPAGFQVTDVQGTVKAALTDLSLPTGERQLVVTIVDDTADLDSASLLIDGSVVFHATRQTGAIVDRNGKAAATLIGYVAVAGSLSIEVTWISVTGVLSSDKVEVF